MVHLDYRDARPIYSQIFDNVCSQIVSGVLTPGDKLPSVRELATQLAINPNTIQRAYTQLETEGYILSVSGKGTFVAELQDQHALRRAELEAKVGPLREDLRSLGMTAAEWAALWEGGDN